VADQTQYRKPYFDSDVFIGWIKDEKIETTLSGEIIIQDRGKIGEHLMKLAEDRVFPVFISGLTIAEVHKHKGREKLNQDENEKILSYFEHDFINVIIIDRKVGEEANKLCQKYTSIKLSPNDAIHLVCAKKAGCDVLLSWDGVLNSIKDQEIRIENPILWIPPKKLKPVAEEQLSFIQTESLEDEKTTQNFQDSSKQTEE